ncbi:MAG: hypothetical protein HUK19_08395 [Fibrobacter sp.]|nr:hypothetical protein [Fibrobacter sp.]
MMVRIFLPFLVAFALFPLTDTDIWWHLACARDWVTPWTPVREPVVNIHEYFQNLVAFVYGLGGAPFLVAFKALLWGAVFALFLRGSFKNWAGVFLGIVLAFIFRYQFEIRPVVLSLLFLGIYWNVLPWLVKGGFSWQRKIAVALGLCLVQWIWCKCQGLYILGPLFALVTAAICLEWRGEKKCHIAFVILFVIVLFAMPFFHGEGMLLAAYPFELLNRLLGLSPSATVFAKEIAENRSPFTLLMEGENFWTSLVMVACALTGFIVSTVRLIRIAKIRVMRRRMAKLQVAADKSLLLKLLSLLTTAILALVAERNFVLFLPVFLYFVGLLEIRSLPTYSKYIAIAVVMFILGLWGRSMTAYDSSFVSCQRVPVTASQWMKEHPHAGRLFNDDRAGGYLAFVNPGDSIYMDGRFIMKTAEFFRQYLHFADDPARFIQYSDSAGIDRAIFPLKYYARWGKVVRVLSQDQTLSQDQSLSQKAKWRQAYRDEFFVIFDRENP